MSRYNTLQLLELVIKIGEEKTRKLLSDFSSPLNPEIETFIKYKSIEFSKQKASITHIVMNRDAYLVGFFTLALKPLVVERNMVSKTKAKKLERFGRYDAATDSYDIAAYLIAQFGKNYGLPKENQIDGEVLMDLACGKLIGVQHEVGGGVTFLECGKQEKLLDFYQREENGFSIFGQRADDNTNTLFQLLRFI